MDKPIQRYRAKDVGGMVLRPFDLNRKD